MEVSWADRLRESIVFSFLISFMGRLSFLAELHA